MAMNAAKEIKVDNRPSPSGMQKWWVAIRPFTLSASVMPIIFGSVLAASIGHSPFHVPLFLAALAAMAILHAGANLLNDVYDYKKGIDRRVNPASGAVVRKWITPVEALVAGWLMLTTGSAIGLGIVIQVGGSIIWIGLAGVAIGILYTWGPMPLKYYGLGDLAVFLDFGILGALGSWAVQTRGLSWVPVVWAVPISILIVAILHANNWRDIDSDTDGNIHTTAIVLGDGRSEGYYCFLLLAPYATILILILIPRMTDLHPHMPLTFLLTFLTLPYALTLRSRARHRHCSTPVEDFRALDAATARLNLWFGLLCVAALVLDALFRYVFR